MSVYNVFILCVIGAPISLVMREQPDASFSIVSVCIIICTSITQCLVFIPKVSMFYLSTSLELQSNVCMLLCLCILYLSYGGGGGLILPHSIIPVT